jgi:hypothetical protein
MIIFNPTNELVTYPIQNPTTKKTDEWTIAPNQTLNFPDYAGEILLERYAFLQEQLTQEQFKDRQNEQKRLSQGQHFTQVRIVNPKDVPPPAPKQTLVTPKVDPQGVTSQTVKQNPVPYQKPAVLPAQVPQPTPVQAPQDQGQVAPPVVDPTTVAPQSPSTNLV